MSPNSEEVKAALQRQVRTSKTPGLLGAPGRGSRHVRRAWIGGYEGAWLRIRDHYPNGPAFGGLVGSAAGFARFLQDQVGERSRVLSDNARALFFEQQRTTNGVAIPMTLGWHMGLRGAARYLYKEGGGGGFHSMMRFYPEAGIGAVVMVNATDFDVGALLDEVDARWI